MATLPPLCPPSSRLALIGVSGVGAAVVAVATPHHWRAATGSVGSIGSIGSMVGVVAVVAAVLVGPKAAQVAIHTAPPLLEPGCSRGGWQDRALSARRVVAVTVPITVSITIAPVAALAVRRVNVMSNKI